MTHRYRITLHSPMGPREGELTLTGEVLDHDRSRHDAAPLEIAGFDTPGYAVEDIVFKDITIQKPSVTLPLCLCRGITLSNISCAEP